MKPNAYSREIQRRMDEIGDALRDVLPGRACFALFTTSESGEQAAMVANIKRAAVRALVSEWLEAHANDGDDDAGDAGGDDFSGAERGGEPARVEYPRGDAALDGGVRDGAPSSGGAAAAGSGNAISGDLQTRDEIARALLWRAAQVERCLDYIAVMEDCFGTLLAATTRTERADYDELMAKLREHMARAPAVMDAMLKSGARPRKQPHLDSLAELPTTPFAPGGPTQH